MALRMRKTHQYISLAAMAAVIAAGGAYLMLKPEPQVAAAPMSQSVLCAPNVCRGRDSDSIQDITLRYSSFAWNIQESGLYSDADKEILEIADQNNHQIQQIKVGVYITRDDVYHNLATQPVQLSFNRRSCHEEGDPRWSIAIHNPDTLPSAKRNLATYDYGASSTSTAGGAARRFCDRSSPPPVVFDLDRQSDFAAYPGNSNLMYAEIWVTMADMDAPGDRYHRNVRFQMQLSNECPAIPGTCREYLATVRAADASLTNPNPVNIAMWNPSASQDVVTNNRFGRSPINNGDGRRVFNANAGSGSRQSLLRMSMEFGLPCSATVEQSLPIYLYDINDGIKDNDPVNTGDIDVDAWIGGYDATGVVVQEYSTAGGWQTITVPLSVTDGHRQVEYARLNAPVSVIKSGTRYNQNLYTVSGQNPSTIIRPSQGQVLMPENQEKAMTKFFLNMKPNTRYRLVLTPVAALNFIAVGLPGDQINGLISCESAKLAPSVTGGGNLAAGNPATFTNSITNPVASTATATDVDWYSYSFVVRRGGSYTAPSSFPSPSTFNFADRTSTCNTLGSVLPCTERHSATPISSIGPGGVHNPGDTTVGPDITAGLSVGDQVCSFLAINPSVFPRVDPSWATSGVVCYTIVAQPKVHIWGNDLRVGSSFPNGSIYRSSIAAGAFTSRDGSAVEYSITTPSYVSLLASQSGAFAGTIAAQSDWSKLTFANTTAGGTACPLSGFGCFAQAVNLGTIPDVQNGVTQLAGLNRDAGSLPVDAGRIRTLSDVADLRHFNRSVSITTTGDITINENIEYDNPGDADAIPQLILIGNNITIAEGVTRVDAWLVASGTVSTCNIAQGASLTSDVCDQPLIINGPIMASRLALNRTYNRASDPTHPAEKIDLRGDAYIWADKQQRKNGSWQTVYTTELPPRY